jgi:hypothetical protein
VTADTPSHFLPFPLSRGNFPLSEWLKHPIRMFW